MGTSQIRFEEFVVKEEIAEHSDVDPLHEQDSEINNATCHICMKQLKNSEVLNAHLRRHCMIDSSDVENSMACEAKISETAKTSGLIPEKSKLAYEKTYCEYIKWCTKMKVEKCIEESFLAYFCHLSKIRKPSSLWSYYSMLKATMQMNHKVDIASYSGLSGFLKSESHGYIPKRAKVFSEEDVDTFLYEAPDDVYLMNKVALIFGLAGACRRQDLANLEIHDIQELQSSLLITLRDTKTKTNRTFSVMDNHKTPSLLGFYKKYSDLRPPNTESGRFFLSYKNGKCTRQVVGKNTFGEIPKKIATYLKLPSPELYTGHSFHTINI